MAEMKPLRGGRAYQLSLRGTMALLAIWATVVLLALTGDWKPEMGQILIWVTAAITVLCGGQHLPNIMERLPGVREFKNGAP